MPKSAPKPQSRALVASTPKRSPARRLASLPYLRSVVDPWNAEMEGAGLPDANPDPTVPWRESWSQTHTTDAQGNLLLQLRPQLGNGLWLQTVSAAADPVYVSTVNQAFPNLTTLQSTFTHYRVTALAIEASYIGEAQLCKGVLGVARTQGTIQVGESLSQITDERFYKETPCPNSVAARIPITDMDFTAIASSPTNSACLSVLALGLPASTACVRVRITMIFEFKISHSQLLSRSAAHTIAHPPQVAVASSLMSVNSILAAGEDPVGALVKHGTKAIEYAGAINGLWQSAKPLGAMLSEFAAFLV